MAQKMHIENLNKARVLSTSAQDILGVSGEKMIIFMVSRLCSADF